MSTSSYTPISAVAASDAAIASPSAVAGTRQEWIDCLRGITMLLVVILHCEMYLIWYPSSISSFIGMFRMPLFFFISGFFAYTSRIRHDDRASALKPLRRRLIGVMWPTVVVSLIFYYCAKAGPEDWSSFYDMMLSEYKGGYWFTVVSVEIFIMVLPLILLVNSGIVGRGISLVVMACIMLASAWFHNQILDNWNEVPTVRLLSLGKVFQYLPYFILGMIVKMYLPQFLGRFNQWWVIIASIALFCIAGHYAHSLRWDVIDWRFTPFICLCLMAVLMLFYRLRGVLNRQNFIGRQLSYIGRNTLQIYLFHYFIVYWFGLDVVQSLYDWRALDRESIFPITVMSAILIVYMCLYADRLLDRIGIRRFIFPKYK